jgi:hypothetical protein
LNEFLVVLNEPILILSVSAGRPVHRIKK